MCYFPPLFLFLAKGAGLADFIQPGLIQLQPNLDDFMDTLEPLHGSLGLPRDLMSWGII